MVLEQLFKLSWIERKEHAFFLGFIYSLLGLASARFIFPASVGLMSVAFTSILLIPSLNILLRLEENIELREKKLSLKLLIKDHKDIIKVYTFMFLGIFLAYSLTSLLFSELVIKKFFVPQLRSAGIYGFAFTEDPLFNLILNNILVFVVCLLLSLVYGAGSILFLTWNASVWGVTFAFFVKQASAVTGGNLFMKFGSTLLPFLPHMTTEALAYISASIAGGVVSKAVLREKPFTKKFHHIITDALIFLVIGLTLVIVAGIIEVKIYANV
ncbi:stage II sporulation protein M [Candidatus Woesearchaeota archaeon]|nr:stage II sporulation protein M [Candidatus Woesearchaeota archaeon]